MLFSNSAGDGGYDIKGMILVAVAAAIVAAAVAAAAVWREDTRPQQGAEGLVVSTAASGAAAASPVITQHCLSSANTAELWAARHRRRPNLHPIHCLTCLLPTLPISSTLFL